MIRGVGAIGALGAVSGVGAILGSQGASATAGGSIEDPQTATSDDGRLKWVSTQTTGRLTWDGFDDPVQYFKIRTFVELKRDGNTINEYLINETDKVDAVDAEDNGWGRSGEKVSLDGDYDEGRAGYIASDVDWGIIQRNRNNIYNDDYGLPENPAPTSPLYADGADGETKKTAVILKAEYILYGGNGAELTGTEGYPDRPQSSAKFVVTVENQESTTGFGNEDAEGDTDNSAGVSV